MDALEALAAALWGAPPAPGGPLPAHGSARRMRRLRGPGGRTLVAVEGPDPLENRAFLSFARALAGAGLPVPKVLAELPDGRGYLVEDLGDLTLFTHLVGRRRASGEDWPDDVAQAYARVVELLPRLQVEGGRAVDFAHAHPTPVFDRRAMRWDLEYFKHGFLRLADRPFAEGALDDDFERLLDLCAEADPPHFLHRDFQSRNVMLRDGEPWILDFQGGRRGPLPYDLASLLHDGKAALPPEAREELLARYLAALARFVPVDGTAFRRRLRAFVLLRILQAFGAYGLRGLHERKPHFLASIPVATRNVERLLAGEGLPVPMPELERVLAGLVATPVVPPTPPARGAGLVVHLGSFSYRRGIPADPGGHGGGWVIDCRGLPNPGREEAFRDRTGLDGDVVRRLEADPATEDLVRAAAGLVDTHVTAWLRRGFTSLQVLCGCTGGQHRSVYVAERLARHLEEAFPGVGVAVVHHEQARWPRRGAADGGARWTG